MPPLMSRPVFASWAGRSHDPPSLVKTSRCSTPLITVSALATAVIRSARRIEMSLGRRKLAGLSCFMIAEWAAGNAV
jgi:hypothetical protein